MLNTSSSVDFIDLLEHKVVFELENIRSSAEKSLIMGFILINLSEAIREKYQMDGKFQHITLVEEAHRLLSKYQSGDSPSKKQSVEMFSDMLAEIRKYGECLIIADQIPNKACNEKLGFDTDGLKSPELVGITAEILSDLAKIKDILSPSDFVVYNKYLQANGMGMKEFSDYLHGCSVNLETFKNVKDALSNAMREITPGISDSDIGKNLYQMNEKVNETFSIGE